MLPKDILNGSFLHLTTVPYYTLASSVIIAVLDGNNELL